MYFSKKEMLKRLLESTKATVEIAIEQGEDKVIEYLNTDNYE